MSATLTDPGSLVTAFFKLEGVTTTGSIKGDRFTLIVDLGVESGIDLTDDAAGRLDLLRAALPQSEAQTIDFVEGEPTQVRWTITAPHDRSSLPRRERENVALRIGQMMGSLVPAVVTIESYTPAHKKESA